MGETDSAGELMRFRRGSSSCTTTSSQASIRSINNEQTRMKTPHTRYEWIAHPLSGHLTLVSNQTVMSLVNVV